MPIPDGGKNLTICAYSFRHVPAMVGQTDGIAKRIARCACIACWRATVITPYDETRAALYILAIVLYRRDTVDQDFKCSRLSYQFGNIAHLLNPSMGLILFWALKFGRNRMLYKPLFQIGTISPVSMTAYKAILVITRADVHSHKMQIDADSLTNHNHNHEL